MGFYKDKLAANAVFKELFGQECGVSVRKRLTNPVQDWLSLGKFR
jgi:hypothetical protein